MKRSAKKLKYKEITSTELKQNTRKVINMVREHGVPYLVKTFDEPKVVIVDFNEWRRLLEFALPNEQKINKERDAITMKVKSNKKSAYEKIKHLVRSYPKMKDSVKFFRKMRDSEGI